MSRWYVFGTRDYRTDVLTGPWPSEKAALCVMADAIPLLGLAGEKAHKFTVSVGQLAEDHPVRFPTPTAKEPEGPLPADWFKKYMPT